MLKKTGIVVATAAAGLLVLSPLAFAGQKEAPQPVSVNQDNQTADCDFVAAGTADATGSNVGLINGAVAVASAATNAVAQAPVLSCNNLNVEDVFDSNSGNTTTTVNDTRNINSGNS